MPANDSEKNKTAGKKTTTKKTTAKKAAAKKTTPKKKPAAKKSSVKRAVSKKESTAKRKISAVDRHTMIEMHAYYQAEARGFEPGSDWDYWLLAEKEVDAMLDKTK